MDVPGASHLELKRVNPFQERIKGTSMSDQYTKRRRINLMKCLRPQHLVLIIIDSLDLSSGPEYNAFAVIQ